MSTTFPYHSWQDEHVNVKLRVSNKFERCESHWVGDPPRKGVIFRNINDRMVDIPFRKALEHSLDATQHTNDDEFTGWSCFHGSYGIGIEWELEANIAELSIERKTFWRRDENEKSFYQDQNCRLYRIWLWGTWKPSLYDWCRRHYWGSLGQESSCRPWKVPWNMISSLWLFPRILFQISVLYLIKVGAVCSRTRTFVSRFVRVLPIPSVPKIYVSSY